METITPFKPVTEEQIGKLNQNLTAKLLKNKGELPSDLFQKVLGDETLMDEFYASIRKRIEAISSMITRIVKVNRNRSAKEALKATGRNQYVDDSVLKTMPQGEGEDTEVVFFKIGRQISMDNLEKEYALRGLKPADPYSQAAVNEADPAFADEHPNGTQWKDGDGKWCYAFFCRGGDERNLFVDRLDFDWNDDWWFAGVRK